MRRREAKRSAAAVRSVPQARPPVLRGRPWFGLYGGDWGAGETWCGPEASLLLLGPPRSGKTSAIVVPCVLDAPAAVVSTSTKPDVLVATAPRRFRMGNCFLFDPSGQMAVPKGLVPLRWSPVTGCHVFERAVATAHALASAARPQAQVTEAAHWIERAEALLAPMLFAAAAKAVPMATVCRWVLARDLREPEAAVTALGHEMAAAVLAGVAATEDRERSGIFSTASGILAAYRSEAALRSAAEPNFDPQVFAASSDSVFICAPAHAQDQLAPLIVCLLEQIRQAVFARPKGAAPVVFALDEVANIAPLPSLPALAAEGGGQGLVTLACLQDLSQARSRWGEQAEGFFSIFNRKVLFPGIGDHRTLSLVSAIAGEVAVPLISRSQGATNGWKHFSKTRSISTSWTYRPRLPIDAITNARPGTALGISAGMLRWVSAAPWWTHRRWSAQADGGAPPVWTEMLRPLPRVVTALPREGR